MLIFFAVLSMVLIFGPFVARAFDLCPAQACMPPAYRVPRADPEPVRPAIDMPIYESIDVETVEDCVRRSPVNKISGILTNFPQESVAIIRTWMMEGR